VQQRVLCTLPGAAQAPVTRKEPEEAPCSKIIFSIKNFVADIKLCTSKSEQTVKSDYA
jgi:hypothetical protein